MSEPTRTEDFIIGRTTVRPEGFYPPGQAQGQLVTGGEKHPWPKGFSPERRKAVHEAVNIAGPPKIHPSQRAKISEELRRDEHTTLDRMEEAKTRQWGDALARTNIPTEHMDVKIVTDKARQPSYYYSSDTDHINITAGYGTDSREGHLANQMTRIMAHEIGHHVSATIDQNPHAANSREALESRTPYERGQEERFADNYAEKAIQGIPKTYKDTDPSRQSGYPHGQRYYPRVSQEAKNFTSGYYRGPSIPEAEGINSESIDPDLWDSLNKIDADKTTIPMVQGIGKKNNPRWMLRDPDTGEWD